MPDQLAVEALFKLLAARPKGEMIGAVYPGAEGLTVTNPMNEHGNPRARSRAEIPANFEALFHNHPVGRDNHLFSNDDIETANKYNKPSFIAIERRGQQPEIRVYRPGETATQGKSGKRTSRGDRIDMDLAGFQADLAAAIEAVRKKK
jgi:hypothetical protein